MKVINTRGDSGFSVLELLLIVIVLGVTGAAGWYVLHNHQKVTTGLLQSTTSEIKADVWTGKGMTHNWSEAANWSHGVPTTGDDLSIDITKLSDVSHSIPQLDADLPDTVFGNITFTGTSNVGVIITGAAIHLAGNLSDDVGAVNAGTQVDVQTNIILGGNTTIRTTRSSGASLYLGKLNQDGSPAQQIDFGAHKLSMISAGKGELELGGSLQGTGPVTMRSDRGGIILSTSNPMLRATVTMQNGEISTLPDSLGTGQITIDNGASWTVYRNGTTTATVNNPIKVSGKGVTTHYGGSDMTSGAIFACLTAGEEGCGSNASLTFAAPVTLAGDVQIGASSTTGRDTFHVNYELGTINRNGHALTVVTDYKATPSY